MLLIELPLCGGDDGPISHAQGDTGNLHRNPFHSNTHHTDLAWMGGTESNIRTLWGVNVNIHGSLGVKSGMWVLLRWAVVDVTNIDQPRGAISDPQHVRGLKGNISRRGTKSNALRSNKPCEISWGELKLNLSTDPSLGEFPLRWNIHGHSSEVDMLCLVAGGDGNISLGGSLSTTDSSAYRPSHTDSLRYDGVQNAL